MSLQRRINDHLEAYYSIGMSPPPFRATVKELKKEVEILKLFMPMCERTKYHWSDVQEYYGCRIQVVIAIED